MVKPLVIDHSEILTINTTSLLIQDGVDDFTLHQSSNDYIYDNATDGTIYLRESVSNSINTQTQGVHINLDPYSLLTTVQGFDSTDKIDLTTATFSDIADISKALEVIPGVGTVLNAEIHGPNVMTFLGDYDVKLSQFHINPYVPDDQPGTTLTPITDSNSAEVYRLYSVFGRSPDSAGQVFWTAQIDGGSTINTIAQAFTTSAEFAQDYGGLSVADFVNDLYLNVLHRTGEDAGVQAWTNLMNSGASQATVMVGFSDSAENRMLTAAATGNK